MSINKNKIQNNKKKLDRTDNSKITSMFKLKKEDRSGFLSIKDVLEDIAKEELEEYKKDSEPLNLEKSKMKSLSKEPK
jgi:hypothetical protein